MTTPNANNKLNSLGTFFQRKRYGKEIFVSFLPTPLDLWNDRNLFGKIDFNGNAVYPSEAFLKMISNENSIFVLNFVADAFNAFKNFVSQMKMKNKISQNSIITNLNPVSGWQSVNVLYHEYIKIVYQSFSTFVKENRREKEFLDVKSFVKLMFDFCHQLILKDFPISKTAFIKSKFCSNQVSGLMIEISSENHDDDKNKVEKFINDPNFHFYLRSARKFGFKVDKNAPWRLIADLKSPNLEKFLLQNTISLDTIFEKHYYLSYQVDRQSMTAYFYSFYSSFISSIDQVVQIERNRSFEKKQINPFSFKDLQNELDDQKWISFYSSIRSLEEKIDQVENFNLSVEQVLQSVGFEKSLHFLNEKLKSRNLSIKRRNCGCF